MTQTKTETKTVTVIKLPTKALREAMAVFRKIAVSNSMPILNCLYFEDGMIRATDLDQEVRWRGRIPASFRMAIPFKELANAIKGPKADELISIGHHPEKPSLAQVKHSQGTYTIEKLSMDDVPENTYGVNPTDPVLLNKLDADLSEILPFCSSDQNRYILNSAHFDRENARMIATDGRRMLIIPCAELEGLEESVTIPAKVCSLFRCKALQMRPASVQLAKRDDRKGADTIAHFMLGDGEWEITTKLVDGNYPNYQQVIPNYDKSESYTAFINKTQAESIVRFLKTIPKKGRVTVRFVGPELTITSRQEEGEGEGASTEIPAIMTPNSDKEIEAAFNHEFLIDILQVGCLTWKLKDELSPLLATGQDRRQAIVMPLRLN